MRKILLFIFIVFYTLSFSQQRSTSAEDSLLQDKTSIGGYGNAFYERDFTQEDSKINLERVVLFVGHSFGDISVFTELELENAVAGDGEEDGEIAFEQAYLKFNLDQNHYITAGLFLPQIGILNEDHVPNAFNGNERNKVESLIIPSTWRELGVGFYGKLSSYPLNYSFTVMNGLSSGGFEHGSGIRKGRFEGKNATANNLAISGSVQSYINNFKIHLSGYFGGSAGLIPKLADSLQLDSGIFGTPVILGEADLQYHSQGLFFKLLGTIVSIPDAAKINRAYANNTPELEYGAYAEIAYDLLYNPVYMSEKQLIVFLRYEKLDLNAQIPVNGIIDPTLNQSHITTGVTYLPVNNVALKFDVRYSHTGKQNLALIINPSPVASPFKQDNFFLTLGMGYSF